MDPEKQLFWATQSFEAWTMLAIKSLDPEAQGRHPGFSLSQDIPQPGQSRCITLNLGKNQDDPSLKWVRNISSTPLTQAQRSLLAKGPNYAIAPRYPSYLEYITAIEFVCPKLGQQIVEEFRANINRVLRGSYPPKSNINRAELQAIRELKRDKSRIVYTANKGVAMVVMDR